MVTTLEERYICAYLCDKKLLNKFNVLSNFYHEVATISLKTKDPKFMQLRLKWFFDAVRNLFMNKFSGAPVIDNLFPIINECKLDLEDFTTIIEARMVDKDYLPFNNLTEYITYCNHTGGVFWKIIMQVYGGNPVDQKAAYLTGSAFAMIGNIRNIVYDSKKMHYKLVFNKQLILKGGKELQQEIDHNVNAILVEAQRCIQLVNQMKVSRKQKRLLLLNVFTTGYAKLISKDSQHNRLFKPTDLPLRYKLKFMWRYILNITNY